MQIYIYIYMYIYTYIYIITLIRILLEMHLLPEKYCMEFSQCDGTKVQHDSIRGAIQIRN